MITQSIFVFLCVATLAFAMVAESHFSNPAISALVRAEANSTGDKEIKSPAESPQKAVSISSVESPQNAVTSPAESPKTGLSVDDHITYNALEANSIPCNIRGASYYECHRMEQAKPYRRGCNRITQCARR